MSTRGRVLVPVAIVLGVTLALLPTLTNALRRNLQAVEVTRSLAQVTQPQALCQISTVKVEPADTVCADERVCYLQQVRANQSGAWTKEPSATGMDLLSVYQTGYAAWCRGVPQQAVAAWTPFREPIAARFAAMGFAALNGGHADDALEWFGAGERLEPSAAMHSGLGQVYHAQGELELALTEFDAALAQSPQDVSILRHAANTAFQAKQYARAQVYCERALVQAPNDWLLWHVLGNVLSAQKLWAQSEAAYVHVVALNPTYSHGNAGLGFALAHQGKWAQARPFFMNVLEYEPSDRQKGGYMAAYAALLADGGDHRAAVEFYRRASDLDPQNGGYVGALLGQFVLTKDCVGLTAWLQERRAKGYTVSQEPVCTP